MFLMSVLPLSVLALIALGTRRLLRQMGGLPVERQIVVKRAMGSGLVGAFCIMSAATAYLLWSYSRNVLLLVVMTLGFAGFITSVIWAARLSLRWSELVLQRRNRSA